MKRKEFIRCTPEEVGIPSGAIMKLLDVLEGGGFTEMHGIMILRHDKICAEGWWAPYAPQLHHALHSLSKTWTATAIGLCEYEGLLQLTDKVSDLLPEKMPASLSKRVAGITVRDVMTMASGSETEGDNYEQGWVESFFARPFEHEPGTFWRYNSHATSILSAIVEKVSGMSMLAYLTPRLFDKIGVDASHIMCYRSADGICLGGHGMFTCTEDNLRLMRLYLNNGVWDGERLLGAQFAADAVSPLMDTAPAHAHTPWIYDNCCGYGYQIWCCRPEGSYRADGAYGQFCVVVPSLDLLVSINETGYLGNHMSHNELRLLKGHIGEEHPVHGPQATLNALFDILLPEIKQGTDALPPSEEAKRLRERMTRLAVPRPAADVHDRSEHPLDVTLLPKAGKISFAMLRGMSKHNEAYPGADDICLHCANGQLRVVYHEGGTERCFTADMRGLWSTGKLVYTEHRELVSDVACAAWWEGTDVLRLSLRWIETENENSFTFTFEDGLVCIHKWVSSGAFDAPQTRDAIYQIK